MSYVKHLSKLASAFSRKTFVQMF